FLDSIWTEENHIGGFYAEYELPIYSPDSLFKIFIYAMESCAAYCNTAYESFIHYNINDSVVIKRTDFLPINSIHILPDNKYLFIESYDVRSASVLSLNCMEVRLISFSKDELISYPIFYNNTKQFDICQEDHVEILMEPSIKYFSDEFRLTYKYANNYVYTHDLNIDTLRKGEFLYIDGEFIHQFEEIVVENREDSVSMN
ncbi:hypothetical protein HNV12_28080, partial [Methanococcoides sp. SA1]|nr:hypothetical protein [Methanococcoides sp. SA1]